MYMLNTAGSHNYSLAATGVKFKSRVFGSRSEANNVMYSFIGKKGLHIDKIYDDKHDKTYCCGKDIKFYVSRIN